MNDKGQITLPKKCREVFGLNPGDAILVLGDEDKGMALVKLGGVIEDARNASGGKRNDSSTGKRADKRYKGKTAVNSLDITVKKGELFALLGVNGAGKPQRYACSHAFRNRQAARLTSADTTYLQRARL